MEKQHSGVVSTLAVEIRQEEAKRDNFIGIIRITGPETPQVRVEMRMENGALDVSEEAHLDALYGSTRTLLFGRETVVNEIIDPMALIKELAGSGKNPFDYLELKVRDGMDHILAESKSVTCGEAFLPKEGFLNTVNEIKHTLSEEAREYTKAYLESALKPRVVLGTRGKN